MAAMFDMGFNNNKFTTVAEVRADRPFLFFINLAADNVEPDANVEPERYIIFIGAYYGPQSHI